MTVALETSTDCLTWTSMESGMQSICGPVAYFRTTLSPITGGSTTSGNPVAVNFSGASGNVNVQLMSSYDLTNWAPVSPGDHASNGGKFFRVKTHAVFSEIPAGSFWMGDHFCDGSDDELPVHEVYVSAFYLQKTEVTKAEWDDVAGWASTHGYDIGPEDGSGKCPDHPVHSTNWYDCVKFCNALSEREGFAPVYRVSGSVYRTGESLPDINYSASGYRLPTEAEWEKAARGGVEGRRFPWGDTIWHNMANYVSSSSFEYDVSQTPGYHPDWNEGAMPYTNPVRAFVPNGYGLHDMAGNLWEWCGDWYSENYYSTSPASDPAGSATGTYRIYRGGSWLTWASLCRVSCRRYNTPDYANIIIGFRPARNSAP